MAKIRLGSWQREILDLAMRRPGVAVAWSQVQPRGRARQYGGRYQRSFLALAQVPGVRVGPYGPRGGLAVVYQPDA